jgi:hypothetical protein
VIIFKRILIICDRYRSVRENAMDELHPAKLVAEFRTYFCAENAEPPSDDEMMNDTSMFTKVLSK